MYEAEVNDIRMTWDEFIHVHGTPFLLAGYNNDGIESVSVIFTPDGLFWEVVFPYIRSVSLEEAKTIFYDCCSTPWRFYPTTIAKKYEITDWLESSDHDLKEISKITRPLEPGEWA